MRILQIAAAVALLGSAAAWAEGDAKSADAQLHQQMTKGADEMKSMKMSGDFDHDFVMSMRMHHQDGIQMARLALESSKDPQVRQWAQQIIDTQTKEIANFDRWLSQHGHTGAMNQGRRGTP